jgi:hypothetical protein
MHKIFFYSLLLLWSASAAFSNTIESSPVETKSNHGTGLLVTGITFSSLGAAALISSGYFYYSITQMSDLDDIGKGINGTIGTIALISGLAFEGISIPFYLKFKKINKKDRLSLNLTFSSVNMKLSLSF